MEYRDLPEFDGHEMVCVISHEKSGLRGFIAIHSTGLGPATGGTRVKYYSSEEEALRDALRLSRAMTYKCALADVPFGGGKAVLILPRNLKSRTNFFKAYGNSVNSLRGTFTTGEDVGIEASDLKTLWKVSPFVNGRKSGDLSPWAALGTLHAIRAALKEKYGSPHLIGRSVAIKGLGKVGAALAELIVRAGGTVWGADISQAAVRAAKRRAPQLKIVSSEKIHALPVDIFAPCALQHDLNERTLTHLSAQIVCGAANNQLANPSIALKLHRKKILYVPDYLANAGGLINAISERMPGGHRRAWVARKVSEIEKSVGAILERSRRSNASTTEVADRMAEQKFKIQSR